MLMLASLTLMLPVLTGTRLLPRIASLLASLFCIVLACGTKEVTLITPALLLLIDWFAIAHQSWTSLRTRLGWHLIYGGTVGTVMLYYFKPSFFLRTLLCKDAIPNSPGKIVTTHATQLITPLQYLSSQFKILLHYLWMFVWPQNICIEYDYKLPTSFFASDSLAPLCVLLAIGIITLLPAVRRTAPLVSFGVLWFFITMSPRTSIVPSRELACDYKTYLASMGWLLVLALGLVYVATKIYSAAIKTKNGDRLTGRHDVAALILGCLMLGTTTYQRNLIWSSTSAFWYDAIIKTPTSARAHNNYGKELVDQAYYAKQESDTVTANRLFAHAVNHFHHAAFLDPCYVGPYSNLSGCYTFMGETDKAIEAGERAVAMLPYHAETLNNLGHLYLTKGKYKNAEKVLQKAIRHRSYYGKAHHNLAKVHLARNRPQDAFDELNAAVAGDFDTQPECWQRLIQVSALLGKDDEMARAHHTLCSLVPDPTDQRRLESALDVANHHFATNQLAQAEQEYRQLCHLAPDNSRHWHNAGEVLFKQKKIEAAQALYERARQCKDFPVYSTLRLVTCHKMQGRPEVAAQLLAQALDTNVVPQHLVASCRNELSTLQQTA